MLRTRLTQSQILISSPLRFEIGIPPSPKPSIRMFLPMTNAPAVAMSDAPQIFVYSGVLERLAALPARPWEVGGWLLGYWSESGSEVVVTHATPPTRGTPFFIRLSGRGHQRRFDQAWAATGGHVTFLGDWHTHPGGGARASERDELALRQLAKDPDFGTPEPLMAIVPTARWLWQESSGSPTFFHGIGGKSCTLAASPIGTLPSSAMGVPVWPWPSSRSSVPT